MIEKQKLNHFDKEGKAIMVDISEKKDTVRVAIARGKVRMSAETLELIQNGEMGKGDVLGVARVAAIMATKKTHELIPMSHQLMITGSSIQFEINKEKKLIEIEAITKTTGKTGIEMEALTAVSIAGLTIYDMCKAVDKKMVIGEIHLVKKTGGKSGTFIHER
ncbi:cyclic pyranopterin monophosphate synthase MoaC [Clostridium sediminicola]|uniref:cyclic pyranopterin monophosphate synthase MoaC n=1 Tax=Clostridium sediminicola TaxID=3114879 RepID=UPI0031F278CA